MGAALLAAATVPVGAGPARADTWAADDAELIFIGEEPGLGDDDVWVTWPVEDGEAAWLEESWIDGKGEESWIDGKGDEDVLIDWEDEWAWSGAPEGEDHIFYTTDWVKRGPSHPGGDAGPVAPVPLPASGLLVLAGVAGLAAVRRRVRG